MTKKKIKKKQEEKNNDVMSRQLVYVLIGMAAVFLVLIIAYFLVNANKQFSYLGLNWDKQMFGEIPLFHTQYVTVEGYTQELYFRNNPKSLELADFPIQYRNNQIYITINDSVGQCPEGTAAFTDFGKFLASLGMPAKVGLTDEELALEMNMPLINCDNSTLNTVLMFQGGDKTKIESNGTCYTISVDDCQMTKAVETIIINTIATARGYVNETV